MSWLGRVGVVSGVTALCGLLAGSGCSASSSSVGLPSFAADSGLDVPDVGSKDSAPGADAVALRDGAGSCSPGAISNFVAVWHPPVGPHAGACTDLQLDLLFTACFDATQSTAACNAWLTKADNAACESCWAGPVTATQWAPFVVSFNPGQNEYVNVGGCIALADPTQTQCAEALQSVLSCDLTACLSNCPIPTTGTAAESDAAAALGACFDQANKGECAGLYPAPGLCDFSVGDSGADAQADSPASFCLVAGMNDAAGAIALKKFFKLSCGFAGPDGGDGG